MAPRDVAAPPPTILTRTPNCVYFCERDRQALEKNRNIEEICDNFANQFRQHSQRYNPDTVYERQRSVKRLYLWGGQNFIREKIWKN